MSKASTPTNAPPRGLAQLRTDLALSRQECAAARAALADERETRMAAEAENAALRQALVDWICADGTLFFADADEDLADLARALRDDPHAARRLVVGPDSQAYTALAAALDHRDEQTEGSES